MQMQTQSGRFRHRQREFEIETEVRAAVWYVTAVHGGQQRMDVDCYTNLPSFATCSFVYVNLLVVPRVCQFKMPANASKIQQRG